MKFYLLKLFSKKERTLTVTGQEDFAVRFHRFKLFLAAYLEAYSEIMFFEERLSESTPIGMPFLRSSTTKMTIATMQSMLNLASLSEKKLLSLDHAFMAIRKNTTEVLSRGAAEITGAPVIVYHQLFTVKNAPIAPNLTNLAIIANPMEKYIPQGFIVTGAGWWKYFDNQEMHDEIDRIMVISQEDPASFSEASATIRERLFTVFPPPQELTNAVKEAIKPLRAALSRPGYTLLIRCLPVKAEHSALVMPEQAYTTPCSDEVIIEGLCAALARTYQPRAIIYRLKLGIRDRAMPFCLSFSILPETHARGSAHTDLLQHGEPIKLHVRRGFSKETEEYSETPSRTSLPAEVEKKIITVCAEALKHLKAATGPDRYEVFWAAGENGEIILLGASVLKEPAITALQIPPHALAAHQDAVAGGIVAFPGYACSHIHTVRNLEDALFFPIGSILSVAKTFPRWSFLHDFAKGAIAGNGTGHGMFARTARRFGRPTIVNLPDAIEAFSSGTPVCVAALAEKSEVYHCTDDDCLKNTPITAPSPFEFPDHNTATGKLWLPLSDIAEMARNLAPLVLAHTLPDSDDPFFSAKHCSSFQDVLNFMYDRAVRDMFLVSTTRKTSFTPAKQLVSDTLKQFWVINLDDGFTEQIKGPTVQLEQIASIPMLAFWEGFISKPWEGPPQIDARGFLSVLYEATVNPELDPASQGSRYTEKNIFMISTRFCSLRCRFGFHFLSLDCLLSDRDKERFIIFQFKGGAANLARRVRRVQFVANLLGHFDFIADISGDTLTARFEAGTINEFLDAMRVVGYLFMHTRQLDMIMGDEKALIIKQRQMLDDMNAILEESQEE